MTARNLFIILLLISFSGQLAAQQQADMLGKWLFNEDQSDVTDKQVEKSLKAADQPVQKRWFWDRRKDIYRGGPPEQELYDHISYDHHLEISQQEAAYLFVYENGFERKVYTDNRRRSISLNNMNEIADFSFGHWENASFLVEARPRDGGFANETYTLINNGTQLRVEMYIKPLVFIEPIELSRVYDRVEEFPPAED